MVLTKCSGRTDGQTRIEACSTRSTEQGLRNKGPSQATECQTVARHFLARGGLFMVFRDV